MTLYTFYKTIAERKFWFIPIGDRDGADHLEKVSNKCVSKRMESFENSLVCNIYVPDNGAQQKKTKRTTWFPNDSVKLMQKSDILKISFLQQLFCYRFTYMKYTYGITYLIPATHVCVFRLLSTFVYTYYARYRISTYAGCYRIKIRYSSKCGLSPNRTDEWCTSERIKIEKVIMWVVCTEWECVRKQCATSNHLYKKKKIYIQISIYSA